MTKTGVIYRLLHPITKEVRYVGQSYEPKSRLAAHQNSWKRDMLKWNKLSQVALWHFNLYLCGLKAEMEIIKENILATELNDLEINTIKEHKDFGFRLLNSQPGGGNYLRSKIKRNFIENPLTYNEVLKIKSYLARREEGYTEKEYGWQTCLLDLELPWDYYIRKRAREERIHIKFNQNMYG